jgi:hypothetical protein
MSSEAMTHAAIRSQTCLSALNLTLIAKAAMDAIVDTPDIEAIHFTARSGK